MDGALAEFKKYLLRSDYPEIDPDSMQICLIQAGDRILPMMSQKASKHALEILQKLGVDVILNSRVKDYDGKKILILQGEEEKVIHSYTLIWTAGVKGNLLQGIDEKAIVGGRLKVNTFGQVDGLENVYAIGDISVMVTDEIPRGHPMVAQVAIQQAKSVAANIFAKVKTGNFSSPFHYVDKGSMATIGKKDAVADLKIAFLDGRLGWLLWSFIHLMSITGFKNRLRVGFSWMMKYFSYDKANQLIIRKYTRN